MNKERIHKLVIKPCDIDQGKGSFQIDTNENLLLCDDCKSPLFYVKIDWGVVAEDNEYGILNNRSNRVYVLREIGFTVYCAECGNFIEKYGKYFYPVDKIIYFDFYLDELDSDDRAEIEVCLNQFNQKGTFESRYKSTTFTELMNKLMEYEKKYPINKAKEYKRKTQKKRERKVKKH